jgi:hypothetical protein
MDKNNAFITNEQQIVTMTEPNCDLSVKMRVTIGATMQERQVFHNLRTNLHYESQSGWSKTQFNMLQVNRA